MATISGTNGDDSINGTSENDVINASNGNDTVFGGDGNDKMTAGSGDVFMDGGTGNDSLFGGSGNDTLLGSSGNDSIRGGTGTSYIEGGDGNDILYGGSLGNTILGGTGNDRIYSGATTNYIDGGDGNDTIYLGNNNDYVIGGSGNDLLVYTTINGGNDTVADFMVGQDRISMPGFINNDFTGVVVTDDGLETVLTFQNGTVVHLSGVTGTTLDRILGVQTITGSGLVTGFDFVTLYHTGNDTLVGSAGADTLMGLGGNDLMTGGGGNDSFDGGDGNDTMTAAAGNATMMGGDGNDSMTSGVGVVFMDGGAGNDIMKAGLSTSANLFGGLGNDNITGTAGADSIEGGDDNDTIAGGNGQDTLMGGAGNDSITTGNGVNFVDAGDGNDFIKAALSTGATTLLGGLGDDNITGGSGSDLIQGDDGNDTIVSGGAGQDTLLGGAGNDSMTTGNGLNFVDGGDGNDIIKASLASSATLLGGAGDDNITGSAGTDFIDAGEGNDTVSSGAGQDTIYGRLGNDSLVGGTGNNYIEGNEGNDIIKGGLGHDTLLGQDGNDTITGGNDDSTIDGGDGDDVLTGGLGSDSIFGRTGNDKLTGSSGNNYMEGNEGNDTITGGLGLNTIYAGIGDDSVTGGNGNSLIFGGEGNDILKGGLANDVIYGEAGNDSMVGSNGNNFLDGGEGNDTITGGTGLSTVMGGVGDDSIVGGAGNMIAHGGEGNDVLRGGAGDDTLLGEAGNDLLAASNGANLAEGGEGNDTITGGTGINTITGVAGIDTLLGGEGNDSITAGSGSTSIDGGIGDDILKGGLGSDTIWGREGNDLITTSNGNNMADGAEGNDTITGGSGLDTLIGGVGNDSITAGTGHSMMDGGDGDDTLKGGAGSDTILGGLGNDSISTSSGNNLADGGEGNDTITGSTGLDTLLGNLGNDSMIGGTGASYIDGGDGNDYISDTAGLNTLIGGTGNDTILGGSGNDLLVGGAGNDSMSGGLGADIFSYDASNNGSDTISGFVVNTDKIQYTGALSDISLSVQGSGTTGTTTLTFTNGTQITINGVTTATLAQLVNVIVNNISGTSGDDTLLGGSGTDSMMGNGGNDLFDGGAASDTMVGSLGNDTFLSGLGNDSMVAGGGNNLFVYNTSNNGNDSINGFVAGTDILQYSGNFGDVTVFQDSLGIRLSFNGTTVLLEGVTGTSLDIIMGVDQTVNHQTAAGNQALTGHDPSLIYTGQDTLNASAVGNDTLMGLGGNDILNSSLGAGNTFAFTANVNEGNDTISGFRVGTDHMGASFSDIASASTNSSGTDITLMGGTNIHLSGVTDTSLDVVFGVDQTVNNQTATGNEELSGRDPSLMYTGQDTLNASTAGNDTLKGLGGNDVLNSSSGSGNTFAFTANVNEGSDTIFGFRVGIDHLGASYESVSDASQDTSGTHITLSGGTAIHLNGVTGTSLDVIFEQPGNTVTGTAAGQTLTGMNPSVYVTGNDTIIASTQGGDTIIGLGGNDVLQSQGGAGNTFQIAALGEGNDTITGFRPGVDHISYTGNFNDLTVSVDSEGTHLHLANGSILLADVTGTTLDVILGVENLPINGTDKEIFIGTSNNDILGNTTSNDQMIGGSGNDIFLFRGGDDTISDFARGSDLIYSSNPNLSFSLVVNSDTQAVLSSNGGSIILENSAGGFTGMTLAEILPRNNVTNALLNVGTSGNDYYGVGGSPIINLDLTLGGEDTVSVLSPGGFSTINITGFTPGEDVLNFNSLFNHLSNYGLTDFDITNLEDYFSLEPNSTISLDFNPFFAVKFKDFNLATTSLDVILGLDSILSSVAGTAGSESLSGRNHNGYYSGNDTITGGAGNDTLTGGTGNDLFVFSPQDGVDTIVDFTRGDDKIQYNGDPNDLYLSSVSDTQAILYAPFNKITINGTSLSGLTLSEILNTNTPITHTEVTVPFPMIGTSGNDNIIYPFGGNYNLDISNGGQDTIALIPSNTRFLAISGFTAGSDVLHFDDSFDLNLLNVEFNYSSSTITFKNNSILLPNVSAPLDIILGVESLTKNIMGTSASESLTGRSPSPYYSGHDIITGGAGNDTLTGGGGNDVFVFSAHDGVDTIVDFTRGVDKIQYNGDPNDLYLSSVSATQAILYAPFNKITINGTSLSGLTLSEILNSNTPITHTEVTLPFPMFGTSGNDNIIYPFGGIYSLNISSGGQDTIALIPSNSSTLIAITGFTAGDDVLHFDDSFDLNHLNLDFFNSSSTIAYKNISVLLPNVSAPLDILLGVESLTKNITGTSASESLTGRNPDAYYSGHDIITGGAGNDTLSGGGGNDVFVFSPHDGIDTIVDFTRGSDKIQYNGSIQDISISSLTNTQAILVTPYNKIVLQGSGFTGMTLEEIISSTKATGDLLMGHDPSIYYTGNDTINGLAGSDTIYGLGGNDLINGGKGNDLLIGGSGNDTFVYNTSSNDSDTILGFAVGTDLLVYEPITNPDSYEAAGVTASTIFGGISITLGSNGTVNVSVSSSNLDALFGFLPTTITGNGLLTGYDANIFHQGHDTIIGGAGNDTIEGKSGNDLITTGDGQDVITHTAGSNLGSDTITDFTLGVDRIQYTGYFTDMNLSGDILTFNGGSGTTGSIELPGVTGASLAQILGGIVSGSPVNSGNLVGWSGDDTITSRAPNQFISPGAGHNTIYLSTNGANSIQNQNGDDTVFANGGSGTSWAYNFPLFSTGSLTVLPGNIGGTTSGTISPNGNVTIHAEASLNGSLTIDGTSATSGSQYIHIGPSVSVVKLGVGSAQTIDGAGRGGNYLIYNASGGINTAPHLIMTGTGNDQIGSNGLGTGEGNDTIRANEGNDSIDAAGGDDSISGGLGNDRITLGSGNDTFTYLAGVNEGNDTIADFTFGSDKLDYNGLFTDISISGTTSIVLTFASGTTTTFSNVPLNTHNLAIILGGVVTGGNTGSLLTGSNNFALWLGDDTITGGSGNDTIQGLRGSDSIVTGGGSDVIVYTAGSNLGNDTITDFARGVDKIQYSGYFTDMSFSGTTLTFNGGSGTTGSINLPGTAGATLAELLGGVISGSTVSSGNLVGWSGDDTITARAANQDIYPGAGNNVVYLSTTGYNGMQNGNGNDTVYANGGSGTSWAYGFLSNSTGSATFLPGNIGGVTNGTIYPNGNVTVHAEASLNGSMYINGSGATSGSQYIYIGPSVTVVELGSGTSTQTIDGAGRGGNYIIYNNAGLGNTATHLIKTGTGDDRIGSNGLGTGEGSDTIQANEGNDSINAGGGNDSVSGGLGNDRITLGGGNDTVVYVTGVNEGNDTISDFTLGSDRLQYNNSLFSDMTVSGTTSAVLTLSSGTTLTFSNISASAFDLAAAIGGVVTGGNTGSMLTGSNTFSGWSGNDTITGGSGSDTIEGKGGNDSIVTGAGSDVIVYTAGSNLGNDTVTDFVRGVDRIQYSGYFTDMSFSGTTLTFNGGSGTTGSINLPGTAGATLAEILGGVLSGSTVSSGNLVGWSGDDTITARAANQDIYPGAGHNTIYLSTNGYNGMQNQNGDDTVYANGGPGTNWAYGFLAGSTGSLTVLPGNIGGTTSGTIYPNGNITIHAEASLTGSVYINGNAVTSGSQYIYIGPSVSVVELGKGTSAQTIDGVGRGGNYIIYNNSGLGNTATHLIKTGTGDDRIGSNGLGTGEGSDTIQSNEGNDSINAGGGNDSVSGGLGNDRITLGGGNDNLVYLSGVNEGNDTISDFTAGTDHLIYNGFYSDITVSGTTNTLLTFASGTTVELTNVNASTFQLAAALDGVVSAPGGNPFGGYSLKGSDPIGSWSGNDTITGSDGADTIQAFSGNDLIIGNFGVDIITTGTGNDTIIYNPSDAGKDIITDFQVGSDKLVYTTLTNNNYQAAGITAVTVGGGLEISFGPFNNQVQVLTNVAANLDQLFGFASPAANTITGSGTINGTSPDIYHFYSDVIFNSTANDTITTGGGNDTIVYGVNSPSGHDVITDFVLGTDKIRFSGSTADRGGTDEISISNDGVNSVITLVNPNYTQITLSNVVVSNAHINQIFQFVNNTIEGTAASETINGFSGHDSIIGNGGFDLIYGKIGNDTIEVSNFGSTVYGGVGDDLIQATGSHHQLFGEIGHDTIIGSLGQDTIDGGAGNNRLDGRGGVDTYILSHHVADNTIALQQFDRIQLSGWNYNQIIETNSIEDGFFILFNDAGTIASVLLEGWDSSTFFIYHTALDKIFGQVNNLEYQAATGPNQVLEGRDFSMFYMGTDTLVASAFGNDALIGYGEDDLLISQGQNNHFVFHAGINEGNDIIENFGVHDHIDYNGSFNDVVNVQDQMDGMKVFLSSGTTILIKDLFIDSFVDLGLSLDVVFGMEQKIYREGTTGNQLLEGRDSSVYYSGNDILITSNIGNDTLAGYGGDDLLTNIVEGAPNYFLYHAGVNEGSDTILGFGLDDRILYDGNFSDITNAEFISTTEDTYLKITLSSGTEIFLAGYDESVVTNFNFSLDRAFGMEQTIQGTTGHQLLQGHDASLFYSGSDTIKSSIFGGDTLIGHGGNDALYNLADLTHATPNIFVYNASLNEGEDTIFGLRKLDRIQYNGNFQDLTVDTVGDNLRITLASGTKIILDGWNESRFLSTGFSLDILFGLGFYTYQEATGHDLVEGTNPSLLHSGIDLLQASETGADTLIGYGGNDTLSSQLGIGLPNTFVYHAGVNEGSDTILNFAAQDHLSYNGAWTDIQSHAASEGYVIELSSGTKITLDGWDESSMMLSGMSLDKIFGMDQLVNHLEGTVGNQLLEGRDPSAIYTGNDTIVASSLGGDTLVGNGGNDVLSSNGGNFNTFLYHAGVNEGSDTIESLRVGDHISYNGSLSDIVSTSSNENGFFMNFSSGTQIFLAGWDEGTLMNFDNTLDKIFGVDQVVNYHQGTVGNQLIEGRNPSVMYTGNDTLQASSIGGDTLVGHAGNDSYIILPASAGVSVNAITDNRASDVDVVHGFRVGTDHLLNISGASASVLESDPNYGGVATTTLTTATNGTIVLLGVTDANLSHLM